ncbi:MAG: response regulator [Pirellulales bacterium]
MEGMRQERCGRVLVADDDPALRNVIRFSLQGAGFEVIACRDGQDALSQLKEQSIDMLVTDMQMPRMSGVELCEKVRSEDRYRDLPVLLLTAKGLELDIERLRTDLGLAEVMFKPFSPRELTRSVARHVREAMEKNA